MKKEKKLLIIDCNSLIHRAFHALPRLTTKKGEPTGALYGFFLAFFKSVKELNPDFVVPVFDFPAPTFRHRKYRQYKANRVKAPQELYDQIPKVKRVLRILNLPILEKKGYEADDLIGTVTKKISQRPGITTVILSGDTDILQLISPKAGVCLIRQGIKDIVLYNRKMVEERYQGLSPDQLVDLRALKGDASDNIPGVPGIGEKTAISLLTDFDSLEKLYRGLAVNSPKVKKIRPRIKELLEKNKKQAFLSKELAEINQKTPLKFNLAACHWDNYDKKKAAEVFKEFEFYVMMKRISGEDNQNKKQAKLL